MSDIVPVWGVPFQMAPRVSFCGGPRGTIILEIAAADRYRLPKFVSYRPWRVLNVINQAWSRKITTMNKLHFTAPLIGQSKKRIRILCVGDVHGQWDGNDKSAVLSLNPDLALFVGDYGNENVPVVRQIGQLTREISSAAVMGNHDAFYTMSMKKGREAVDVVKQQHDALGDAHVSYLSRSFSHLNLSVVGGRPYTWGGPRWRYREFYKQYFNIDGMSDSAKAICNEARQAKDHTIIFLAHNGPSGLGSRPWDPCGKDFGAEPGGDYGDPDLRQGINAAKSTGKKVPLVVFGHMHQKLKNSFGVRSMVVTENDTVMVNAAVVPRKKPCPETGTLLSHFVIVELESNHSVSSVDGIWSTSDGEVRSQENMYRAPSSAQGLPVR